MWLPIESVILKRQANYYAAINASNTKGESSPFVEYMLEVIKEALEPYAGPVEDKRRGRQRTLLNLLREKPNISTPKISAELGVSVSSVDRLLASLRKEDKIERQGPRHGGIWVVKFGTIGEK